MNDETADFLEDMAAALRRRADMMSEHANELRAAQPAGRAPTLPAGGQQQPAGGATAPVDYEEVWSAPRMVTVNGHTVEAWAPIRPDSLPAFTDPVFGGIGRFTFEPSNGISRQTGRPIINPAIGKPWALRSKAGWPLSYGKKPDANGNDAIDETLPPMRIYDSHTFPDDAAVERYRQDIFNQKNVVPGMSWQDYEARLRGQQAAPTLPPVSAGASVGGLTGGSWTDEQP